MKWLEAGAVADDGLRAVAPDEIEAAVSEGANALLSVLAPAVTDASALKPWFGVIARLTVVFAGFRDGRGFSLGQSLRELGFEGELIAAGDLLPDHAPMLSRTGFDAAELPPGSSVAEWDRALASFDAVYQTASDGQPTVWALREAARSRGTTLPAPAPIPANESDKDIKAKAAALNAEFRDASAEAILKAARSRFPGRVAVLSSFGTEAAVGLHMMAQIDPATPVLFLDTERHFAPTLSYRDQLAGQLGLTDVRVLTPRDAETHDPKGDLWRTGPDQCCGLRKVAPLAAVARDFDVLVTGRKRMHGGVRMRLPVFEVVGGQIRVNPLANWTGEAIEDYFVEHALPRHPLTQGGYRSVGCWPCTQPSSDEEDVRAGRWSGLEKTECGIHMPERWAAELDRRAS
jgi:phosphoadenosine phosphosulfate reductase